MVKIVAYSYYDPLLTAPPPPDLWGWEMDAVYQDQGGRTSLAALLNQPPTHLVIRTLTELADSLAELQAVLQRIEELNIQLIVTEAAHQQPLDMLAQIPRTYQNQKLRQGHARRRLQLAPPPGKAPYGYRKSKDRYLVDKSVAPVVKEFFERFLLLGSLRGAVRYLEKKYGKKIAASTGLRWLQNPVYRGDTAYGQGVVIPNTHPPLLSRDEAAQIDRLLRRNQRLPSRTASAPRSLAGLVTCADCQTVLTISTTSQPRQTTKYTYLRATKCPLATKCAAISYDQVLAETIDQICQELPLAVSQLGNSPVNVHRQQLQAQIEKKQQAIEQLATLVTQEILDVTTADLRRYQLQAEIATVEQQIAALPPANLLAIANTVSLRQFWLDLSESERRFYLREFIASIQLQRITQSSDTSTPAPPFRLSLKFIF
jgi:DNA invertase Pin-like site-specific DNA recombinase